MARQNKKNNKPKVSVSRKITKEKNIRHIFQKMAVLTFIVFCVVYFTDSKGWFISDQDKTNNHSKRRWDTYYHFTKRTPVDIVLVGNSRLYTGINPKNLSTALGANCFILAAGGTNITDVYYNLKEAISVCKPKIAVIEIHTISDYVSHDLKDGALSNAMQSFNSRQNFWQKIASTPILFAPDNYFAAWSNTIRNHSFIFTDIERVKQNIKTPPPPTKFDKLYLGRYVRFQTGIEDSTLVKYDIPDIIDFSQHSIGKEATKYMLKIIELCRKNNVEPVFFTVPVYYRHTKDYEPFKKKIAELLQPYNIAWLDLQLPYDTVLFTPDCFENTTEQNQHMTYAGSLIATYKLAHFINEHFADKLPMRKTETNWRKIFYGEEGFFENNTPDKNNVIAQNIVFENMPLINELNVFPQTNHNILHLKLARSQKITLANKIILTVSGKIGNVPITTQLIFQSNKQYDPIEYYLLTSAVTKDVVIEKILEMKIE